MRTTDIEPHPECLASHTRDSLQMLEEAGREYVLQLERSMREQFNRRFGHAMRAHFGLCDRPKLLIPLGLILFALGCIVGRLLP